MANTKAKPAAKAAPTAKPEAVKSVPVYMKADRFNDITNQLSKGVNFARDAIDMLEDEVTAFCLQSAVNYMNRNEKHLIENAFKVVSAYKGRWSRAYIRNVDRMATAHKFGIALGNLVSEKAPRKPTIDLPTCLAEIEKAFQETSSKREPLTEEEKVQRSIKALHTKLFGENADDEFRAKFAESCTAAEKASLVALLS